MWISKFLKRQRLTKEDLEEIGNNSEDSEYSDESIDISCESEDESSDIQHGTWTNVGTERPRFPFIRKPDLNMKIENSENPLKFFELFITPEIAELINRELR